MKLYAGYDGGGTKTACVLVDQDGRYLGNGIGGPSNYLYCGKETAAASVREATAAAFERAGIAPQRLETAYMASAAILLQHGESHVPFFASCIDADRVLCESDIFPIWFGAVKDAPAIVQIAGTGALTYVCSKDGFHRVSGWGPYLGDEGSGFDLGSHALHLLMRMSDGRLERDAAFSDAIYSHYGITTPGEMVRVLNRGEMRSLVASCAKVVFRLYHEGNETAKGLLKYCADELALSVLTAARAAAHPEPLPLILSGSLVARESALISMLTQRLLYEGSPVAWLGWPKAGPAVASAALALHHDGRFAAVDALLTCAERNGL